MRLEDKWRRRKEEDGKLKVFIQSTFLFLRNSHMPLRQQLTQLTFTNPTHTRQLQTLFLPCSGWWNGLCIHFYNECNVHVVIRHIHEGKPRNLLTNGDTQSSRKPYAIPELWFLFYFLLPFHTKKMNSQLSCSTQPNWTNHPFTKLKTWTVSELREIVFYQREIRQHQAPVPERRSI